MIGDALGYGFEALWELGRVPAWLGWALMTGGLSALSWLHGARLR